MQNQCRFSGCMWTGYNTLEHCVSFHPKFIIQMNDENAFTFSFSDIAEQAFLLVSSGGNLYWFLRDPAETIGCIRRGIFAVGQSEMYEYVIKIGRLGDAFLMYIGPCDVQPYGSNDYNVEWTVAEIALINEGILSKSMQIFFGPYDDGEVCMADKALTTNKDKGAEEIKNLDSTDCFACLNNVWNRENCPICRSALAAVDYFDEVDKEELLQTLLQY